MRQLYLLLTTLISFISTYTKAQDKADFTFTLGDNYTVHFTNTSTLSGDGDRKAYWSFGDNTRQATAALANTDHQYSTSGTYTVCLKIYKYYNYHDSVATADICKTVTLSPLTTERCEAGFAHEAPAGTALTQVFVAKPANSANKKPELICWNFGDQHDTCIKYDPSLSSNYAVYHTYREHGLYKVCVKITYQGGCVSDYCNEVQVGEPTATCSASFRTEAANASSLLQYFIAQPANSANLKPELVCWNFGDNHDTCIKYGPDFSGNYAVSHKYSSPGTYKACVKIQYQGGCYAYYCNEVQAAEAATCKASFTLTAGNTPLRWYFVSQPENSLGKRPEQVCWNFGDNHDTCISYNPDQSYNYVVSHTYREQGIYKVCVRIKYQGGCVAEYCHDLQAGEPTATCKVDYRTETGDNPLVRYFIAQPSNSLGKRPLRICWTFGDGKDTCVQYTSSSTVAYAVRHLYEHAGRYEACVKVLFDGGCEAHLCKVETVSGPAPDTCFIKIQEAATNVSNLERRFYAGLTPGKVALKICWRFGDGKDSCVELSRPPTDRQLVMTHVYPAPGRYEVCANVWYDGGCTAHICRIVEISHSTSNVCGGYFTDSLAGPNAVVFKGYGIQNADDHVISWLWSFGDGTGGNSQLIKHSYASGGTYEVCLNIRTDKGCQTKICKPIVIQTAARSNLVLSPNPVVNVLHAVFYSTLQQEVNVFIYNSNGLLVRSYKKVVVTGTNTWEFDVSTLVPGIYSVVVSSPNQLANAVFIKQ